MPRKPRLGAGPLILLDNEAVQALLDQSHPKHVRAISFIEAALIDSRLSGKIDAYVPTAVRVEAGWDRRRRTGHVPRYRVNDLPLDQIAADLAAELRSRHADLSVADAHLGAEIARAPRERSISVITSDRTDPLKMALSADRDDAKMRYL